MSYKVVEEFEQALSEYTGAPYVVTTNSCSMALMLALAWDTKMSGQLVRFPSHTYCSAPMAAINVGLGVWFEDFEWQGEYEIYPTCVWDSARRFTSGMHRKGQMQCVSFQTSKILGLEQGGAILHDNKEADEWLRRARFDGRLNASEKVPKMIGFHAYLSPSVAALGIQKLACLPRDNPDQIVDFPDLSLLDIWN